MIRLNKRDRFKQPGQTSETELSNAGMRKKTPRTSRLRKIQVTKRERDREKKLTIKIKHNYMIK